MPSHLRFPCGIVEGVILQDSERYIYSMISENSFDVDRAKINGCVKTDLVMTSFNAGTCCALFFSGLWREGV